MSKVDAQRALREARYARFAAAKKSETAPAKKSPAKAPAAGAKTPAAPPAAEPVPEELFPSTGAADGAPAARDASAIRAAPASDQAPSDQAGESAPQAEAEEELCGHRSMNGRSCTRVKGHEQKNHRYT